LPHNFEINDLVWYEDFVPLGKNAKLTPKWQSPAKITEINDTNARILSHWIFTSPRAMIGGTILCLAILFCCWKVCTRNQAPLPYPPASSAPTVFNMTVDPILR